MHITIVFPFTLNSYGDLEKFTLEFRDVEDNLINFNGQNKAYGLVQLNVEIQRKTERRRNGFS